MSDINFINGLPARLNANETAKLLGFAEHDIPVLTAAKLLDPLGTPAPNAPKFYARVVVLEHANNVRWLDKATRAIGKYWQTKRARRTDASFEKSDGDCGHVGLEKPSVKPSVAERRKGTSEQ
ncbi:MAG: hypothetical protein WBW41_06155 [Verrucomicrobiia bacterium]